MSRPLTALLLVSLLSCGSRPMTDAEQDFSATVHGNELDVADVKVTRGALIAGIPVARDPRPYVACRERILPRETEQKVRWTVGGFVLGERVFISREAWREDFLSGYPDVLPLSQAMFVAHEMTHVWQWQHRDVTGYSPWRVSAEHGRIDDPYLFDVSAERSFLDYGYEQQAALVEEFVCCRALDPRGDRTQRLYDILLPEFPELARYGPKGSIDLPWDKAQTDGICSQRPEP